MPIEQKVFGKTPFTITNEMKRKVEEITFGISDEIEKAKSILEWMNCNIEYKRGNKAVKYVYKPAHYVYYSREGICLDMSYLYTTFARYVGLEAGIADVFIDDIGERVKHACSSLLINGDLYFVDPAYKEFDIEHKGYEHFTDNGTIEYYYQSLLHAYEPREGGVYKKSENLEEKVSRIRDYGENNRRRNLLKKQNEENFEKFKMNLVKAGLFIGAGYFLLKCTGKF